MLSRWLKDKRSRWERLVGAKMWCILNICILLMRRRHRPNTSQKAAENRWTGGDFKLSGLNWCDIVTCPFDLIPSSFLRRLRLVGNMQTFAQSAHPQLIPMAPTDVFTIRLVNVSFILIKLVPSYTSWSLYVPLSFQVTPLLILTGDSEACTMHSTRRSS